MDFSFPKELRLRKRREFKKVYEEGRKVYSKYFTIHYLENQLGRPRLGITVTKKVGKSVVRNRWKRLIREAFRLNRHQFPPWDIVITVKRGYKPPKFREVEKDLVETIVKVAQQEDNKDNDPCSEGVSGTDIASAPTKL